MISTRLLFCLLWLAPIMCFGASFTSYFYNVEALTNVTARNSVRGLTGVFTNGVSAGASTFTGEVYLDGNNTLYGNLIQSSLPSVVVSNANYNSFPGLAYLPNGNLIGVYRRGSANVSTNGAITSRVSTDGGVTWASEVDVYTVGTGNIDVRDPEIVLLANGTLLLSFFKYNVTGSASTGVFVMIGTPTGNTVSWGSPISVTSTFTIASPQPSCSSKPIQLANGWILLPIYGRNTGDTRDSSAVVKSTDNGLTWGDQVTLASNPATQQYNEANGVQLASGRIVIIIRHDQGTTSYSRVISDDNGATWSAVANVITSNIGSPGRPCVSLLPSQKLFLICRTQTPYLTGYTASNDEGATWNPFENWGVISNQNQYASTIVKPNGTVGALIATAPPSAADAQVFYQEFADGPVFTPVGNEKAQRIYGTDITLYDAGNNTLAVMTNLNGRLSFTKGAIGTPFDRDFSFYVGNTLAAKIATNGVISFGSVFPTASPSQRPTFSGNVNPGYVVDFTPGAADEKFWETLALTKVLHFRALNDAVSSANPWLTVTRGTGTAIASVVFPRDALGIGGVPSPTSTLHVAGSIGHSIATGTAFTLTSTNEIYLLNVDAQTVTLPTAVGVNGRTYTIKAIAPCTTGTVATTSSQLIDGATTYGLSASNKFVRVISDNARWWIIGQN